MLANKKILVVLPAYNAARTLERTFQDIPFGVVHPDYQYPPNIIPALAGLVASGEYEAAIGSRILGGKARQGGMPFYKYVFNRILTLFQNLLLGAKLSEYH